MLVVVVDWRSVLLLALRVGLLLDLVVLGLGRAAAAARRLLVCCGPVGLRIGRLSPRRAAF